MHLDRCIHELPCSGLFLVEKNFTNLLGGIELDENGNIIRASSILHEFYGKMNTTQALLDVHNPLNDVIGVYVRKCYKVHTVFAHIPKKHLFQLDTQTKLIEAAIVEDIGGKATYDGGMVSYLFVENSFNVLVSQAIVSDITTVVYGFCIVLVYVVVMLGTFFDKIKNRVDLCSLDE